MVGEIRESSDFHSTVYLGADSLTRWAAALHDFRGRILVLCDPETAACCLPVLLSHLPAHALHVTQAVGEPAKDIQECVAIWNRLTDLGFGRGDLLINLGGGVVTDLGGFAASTFKRGMRFHHLPTSLLAMADAAIGGKTGINLQDFKNQIGTFQHPEAVVIHTPFLQTLPPREIRSGYAEVLKHYLIHDRQAWESAAQLPALPLQWEETVQNAVKIKRYFTDADPRELGIRKALNFGHTIGHALESHFLGKPEQFRLLHGEAVAVGMACESAIAARRGLLDPAAFTSIRDTLDRVYGRIAFSEAEIPAIAANCLQDKKNTGTQVNATLLAGIGTFALDQRLTLAEIEGSLHDYLKGFPPLPTS